MLIVLLSIMIYFLPTVIARWRSLEMTSDIFVVNVFFGWTIIGWVLALYGACTEEN